MCLPRVEYGERKSSDRCSVSGWVILRIVSELEKEVEEEEKKEEKRRLIVKTSENWLNSFLTLYFCEFVLYCIVLYCIVLYCIVSHLLKLYFLPLIAFFEPHASFLSLSSHWNFHHLLFLFSSSMHPVFYYRRGSCTNS